jgi:hypothetical protein
LFGGKDEKNNRLNDSWLLKLEAKSNTWKLPIPVSAFNAHADTSRKAFKALPRSGHSVLCYNNFMLVYGGIHEITKELDDVCLMDLDKLNWK